MRPPLGAPLDPDPDEARSLLRRELLGPDYHRDDLLGRLLAWVGRQLDRGLAAAAALPPLTTVVATVVLVTLAVLVGVLLSRVRRSREAALATGPVVGEATLAAGQWRERSLAALDEDRFDDALVDGFRALAVGQVERGMLADAPGATAREVALVVADGRPEHRDRLLGAARRFDEVLYGRHAATREQAEAVLALGAELEAPRARRRSEPAVP